jgi:CubicO group peptidase (beta-lactamase class C family)
VIHIGGKSANSINGAAALLLYEEGKFKLDDPVSKYLPELKGLRVHTGHGDETVEAKHEMTVRDLLRHTSGLTYGMPNGTAVDKLYLAKGIDGPGLSLAEMVTALGKLPLQDQPGTRFDYSIATDVLARLIEVLSDKPIDEFLQERLCRPLDLRDTGFIVPNAKLSRFTASHRLGEGYTRGYRRPGHEPIPDPTEVPVGWCRSGFDSSGLRSILPNAPQWR